MNILAWLILGAVAGWLANLFMGNDKLGLFGNIALGIVGSFIGGYIMNLFGKSGITGFDFYSLFVAALGAILLIFIVKKIK